MFDENLETKKGPSDFRLLLQNELVQRCKKNPKYSLRAFARFLNIESSRLSKILRNERPINIKLIESLGQKLGLKLEIIENYKESSKEKRRSYHVKPEENKFVQLSQDTFEVISDWPHYSILELMKVDNFEPNPKWISKCLDLQMSEVQACIERLQRVGLLKITNGKWIDTSGGFSTHLLGENYTSYAHRKYQEQVLTASIHSLHNVDILLRDQSSMMMATSTERIEKAKKMITKFRRELCAFLEATPKKEAVYQVSISLFPISIPGRSKGVKK